MKTGPWRKCSLRPAPNALLVSGATGSGDEVYVEARNRLLAICRKSVLGSEVKSSAEMVGISKISSGCYEEIIDYARHRVAQPAQLNYENALRDRRRPRARLLPCGGGSSVVGHRQ